MAVTYNDLYLDVRRQLRESGVEASTLEGCHTQSRTSGLSTTI